MAVKRALAEAVMRVVEVNRISARAAAYTVFGVSQSRFSDLRRGRLHRFTADSLINMLAHAGYEVTVDVSEAADRRIGRRRRRRRDLARDPARDPAPDPPEPAPDPALGAATPAP